MGAMQERDGVGGVGVFDCEPGVGDGLGLVAGSEERLAAQAFDLGGVEGFAGCCGGSRGVVQRGEGVVEVAGCGE